MLSLRVTEASSIIEIQSLNYMNRIVITNKQSRSMNFKTLLSALCLLFVLTHQAAAQQTVQCVENATISTFTGATQLFVCQGDGVSNIIRFKTKIVPTPSAYIVTDVNGNILYVSTNSTINFEVLPPGELRVYGVSYIGQLLAAPGLNIFTDELGSICGALTTNFITINNVSPDGATVAAANGSSSVIICSNDATPDVVGFTTTSTSPLYAYLVTDANNIILQVSASGNIDFSGLPDGTCRVWGFAYVGGITAVPGANATTANLSTDCFDLSDNFVTVSKTTPDGGTVALQNGDTSIESCTGANVPDLVFSNQSTSPASYGYVLTDEADKIIQFLTGNSLDISGLTAGTYRVWGFSYVGNITAVPGDNVATAALTDGCYEVSENFVSIVKRNLEGGTVALETGGTATFTCDNDGVSDELTIVTSVTDPEESYIFIVTNELNNIVGTSTDGVIDFEGSGPGVCRVWGLAYSGDLTITNGQNAAQTALSDECYRLSDNFVEVAKKEALGGTVMLENGDDIIEVCAGDGGADALTFITEDGTGESYIFLVTDEDDIILSISTDGIIDFENETDGHYRVYGVAYTGDLDASVGDNATSVVFSAECYDLSDNFVEVDVTFVDGGSVSILGGAAATFVCANDGVSDLLTFDFATTAVNSDYTFIVTDEANKVLALMAGNSYEFDNSAPEAVCRVWGLSFTGTITVQVGDIITETALTSRCYELSEGFVEVRKEETHGGEVAESDGEDAYFVCPDGLENVLSFSNTGTSTGSYTYVITNGINTIVAFPTTSDIDFDVFDEGTYRLYGLAYTGNVTAVIGDNAANDALSDECYSLSDNFITITVGTPEGGSLEIQGGTEAYTCPADSEPDVLTFDNPGASNVSYALLITDEADKVVAIADGTSFDFGTLTEGTYRVYGVAYTGALTVVVGDEVNSVDLSEECFDLSDNFATVRNESPEGGTVAFAGGGTEIFICPDGAGASTLFFESDGATSGTSFVYIITDEDNAIVLVVDGSSISLDGFPEGTYRVWGVAYTGLFTAQIGDDAANDPLSDGCFDLSDNFITIVNEEPEGGTVWGPGSMSTFDFCTGDGDADALPITVLDGSAGSYAYLITDEDGFLLGILPDNNFDFENSSIDGVVRIYGVAYTGDLLLFPGDDVANTPASNDCYDLSDNFITVNLTIVDGNTIFSDVNGTETLHICAGDGEADPISFFTGTLGSIADYRFVITTEDNVILGFVTGNQQNFEITVGFDRLRIWGLAFTGNLNTTPFGQDITEATLSSGCFDLSDNYIDITRDLPDGGEVISNQGETDILLCIGAESGVITIQNTSTSISGYVYLVTTEDNEIVHISDSPAIDFNTLPVDVYRIWGLSYTGALTAFVGQIAVPSAGLASSCFELSNNFVRVDRAEPVDGGEISDVSGETFFYTCPDDNNGDLIVLQTTSLDPNYQYVITNSDGKILIPNVVGDVIDFDGATPGTYRVYGISYNGNPLYIFGTNVTTDALSDNCYVTSSNFITVIVEAPEGGTITASDGTTEVTVTNGDGEPDVVSILNAGASNTPYAYVITNDDNTIVDVMDDNSYDFEGLAAGVYHVWGVAYTGSFSAISGVGIDTAALSDDCFDLSDNFVQVNSEPLTFGSNPSDALAQPEVNAPVLANLKLSPNPAQHTLVADVNINHMERPTTSIRIFSATGQLIFYSEEAAVEGANRYNIGVSDLTPGLYLLQVANGKTVQTAKFAKQ